MNYKYNELDYAKSIYENGFQTKHLPTELRLLAIYMKTILNYKPKLLKEKMYKFCGDNIPDYDQVKYYKSINRALNQATKKTSKLVTIKSIDIYDHEMKYINELSICDSEGCIPPYVYDCRKIIFTLLCQMKINKAISKLKNGEESKGIYFKGGNRKYNNLKIISNIPEKIKINEDIINILSQCGVITILFNGLIKLDFMEFINKANEKNVEWTSAINIMNFDSIGLYFDYYNNIPNIKLCKQCNQPFKQTKQNILYCSEHKDYYTPVENKTIKCTDCGCEVVVDSKNNTKKRCNKCYNIYRREYDKQKKRDKRAKNKSLSTDDLES